MKKQPPVILVSGDLKPRFLLQKKKETKNEEPVSYHARGYRFKSSIAHHCVQKVKPSKSPSPQFSETQTISDKKAE